MILEASVYRFYVCSEMKVELLVALCVVVFFISSLSVDHAFQKDLLLASHQLFSYSTRHEFMAGVDRKKKTYGI